MYLSKTKLIDFDVKSITHITTAKHMILLYELHNLRIQYNHVHHSYCTQNEIIQW